MVKSFELILVTKTSLPVEGAKKINEDIKKLISGKGKIEKQTDWGKRVFAYPIKKEKEGNYSLFNLEIDSTDAPKLSDKLRLTDSVLRFLLVCSK